MKTLGQTSFAIILIVSTAMVGNAAIASEQPQKKATSMATMPMHEQMQNMRERMMGMINAKSPEDRKQLMKEHMVSMQGMMKMMHGMMAGQASEEGKHRHGKSSEDAADAPCAGDSRMGKMEQRMNMMQLMMEQMMKSRMEQMDKG